MNRDTILLVEDSRDDEELVRLALGQAGVRVALSCARDGEEACEMLADQKLAGGLRLVLLDLKIPKLNGFEVLRKIRQTEATRLVPVVVFTSSDVASDVERAYELGANCYVCKPVEFVRYSEVVQQIGRFWLELNKGI